MLELPIDVRQLPAYALFSLAVLYLMMNQLFKFLRRAPNGNGNGHAPVARATNGDAGSQPPSFWMTQLAELRSTHSSSQRELSSAIREQTAALNRLCDTNTRIEESIGQVRDNTGILVDRSNLEQMKEAARRAAAGS